MTDNFFDTVTINTASKTKEIYARALEFKVNLRLIDDNGISVSFDETTKTEDINNLFKIFGIKDELKNIDKVKINSIESSLKRKSNY